MDVLVDTSVWSLALRRTADALGQEQRALVAQLRELAREGRVRMVGPIRQELLSGIRDEGAFARLRERLRAFDDAPLTTEDYEEAAGLNNRCRAAGVAGTAVDFLLCVVAVRRNWEIFTTDGDFRRYAQHAPVHIFGLAATP